MTSSVSRNSNAFALLQEENRVFRKKEKKEKSLLRRALRDAERSVQHSPPPVVPVARVVNAFTSEIGSNVKWSDVLDDDDDDDDDEDDIFDKRNHLDKGGKTESVCSDISEDEEEEDEVSEEVEHELEEDVVKPTNVKPSEPDAPTPIVSKPVSNRPLSKKQREILEQKEKEDFEALLSDMGLASTASPNNDLQPELQQINVEGTESATVISKNKKKKKKKDSGTAATSTDSLADVVIIQQLPDTTEPGVKRQQALAAVAAKKAATAKKPKAGGVASLAETVLAEAKKRAELKKSKQKRDKHMFEH